MQPPRLVPSIEQHRIQLLQHVTVYGLRHAMWVIGNPSGVPYRVVHVKYPDVLAAAWLGVIKEYMEKVCPFGDPESPPPTINSINTALGETEVTKHARSIAVVLQNVEVRRNLLRVSAPYYTTTDPPSPNHYPGCPLSGCITHIPAPPLPLPTRTEYT